ncbi:uncharacterized protein LOC110525325 isoform X2 [Oncorhynchus mykiss]|uniref:uncharacterized protein LOC110525325 isoform X2 n=1 Tax=Oncorhynchus mykiss TaxID=8022 RepID=UPI0018787789|nr:uncharacterized protein LOC110525325 isoform X2 [Oncorhynchus mykiss]
MYPKRKSALDSQIISAEIALGLVLCTAYRIISKNIFSQREESQPVDSEKFELTRSLVCVWLASNIKFLLIKCNSNPVSLSAHSTSRLIRPTVDMAVCSFFIVSSVVLFFLDHSQLQSRVDLRMIFSDSQKFFLQMDFFATFVFGLLWLAFPDWLLGFQPITGSEDIFHLHLSRAFGAMMVGDSFVSFTTQNFQPNKEKPSVFISRAVGSLVLLVFLVHSQLTTSAWAPAQIWFGLVGASLWTGNSILGYLSSKQQNILLARLSEADHVSMVNQTTAVAQKAEADSMGTWSDFE